MFYRYKIEGLFVVFHRRILNTLHKCTTEFLFLFTTFYIVFLSKINLH